MVFGDLVFNDSHARFIHGHFCQSNASIGGGQGSFPKDSIYLFLGESWVERLRLLDCWTLATMSLRALLSCSFMVLYHSQSSYSLNEKNVAEGLFQEIMRKEVFFRNMFCGECNGSCTHLPCWTWKHEPQPSLFGLFFSVVCVYIFYWAWHRTIKFLGMIPGPPGQPPTYFPQETLDLVHGIVLTERCPCLQSPSILDKRTRTPPSQARPFGPFFSVVCLLIMKVQGHVSYDSSSITPMYLLTTPIIAFMVWGAWHVYQIEFPPIHKIED